MCCCCTKLSYTWLLLSVVSTEHRCCRSSIRTVDKTPQMTDLENYTNTQLCLITNCMHHVHLYVVGIVRIACTARSMHLSGGASVRLSVCLIRSPHAAATGLLLWARRVGDICRLLHGRHAPNECGQCHVLSVRSSRTQTRTLVCFVADGLYVHAMSLQYRIS